jgi:hypothetical protein
VSSITSKQIAAYQGRHFARAAKPRDRGMNQTEKRYAERLEALRINGTVRLWAFEKVKIRLADNTFYTPDFFVVMADDTIEFHETKGFWEDDARVKIKVAAETFPARFLAARLVKGVWEFEEF